MTILFGVIARLPFAFAAGLGINSFVATTLVGSLTWAEAMGLVVINGLIIVLLAATGCAGSSSTRCRWSSSWRSQQVSACSSSSSGLSTPGSSRYRVPSPPVGLVTGAGSISSVPTVVFVVTLLLTGILVARKVRGGILIGLVAGTVVRCRRGDLAPRVGADHPGGWSLSVPTLSGSPFALPDLSLRRVQPGQLRSHRR